MPDSSPTPAPAPSTPAAPAPPPQEPGDFNQAQLETIRKSEGVARVAKKAEYNPRLLDEGMSAATPDALLAKCTDWRRLSREALDATTEKEESTGKGEDAETLLRREIEFFRGKARLAISKNPAWTEPEIEAFKARYFISKSIFASRSLAEQAAGDILNHAREDFLPGVTAERIALADAALARYIATEEPQSGAQSDATERRKQRDRAFDEALRLRHEIQFSADTGWPWWSDVNLGTRGEFLLPAGRAFTG